MAGRYIPDSTTDRYERDRMRMYISDTYGMDFVNNKIHSDKQLKAIYFRMKESAAKRAKEAIANTITSVITVDREQALQVIVRPIDISDKGQVPGQMTIFDFIKEEQI